MAVLTPQSCILAIQALVLSVDGTGQVHTRRRIIRDESALKKHLWDPDHERICGWFISPAQSNSVINIRHPGYTGHGIMGGGNVITTFQFQIEGMFAVDDANQSEKVFSDLVYAVADRFEAYGSIPAAGGGVLPGIAEQLPVTVEQFGYIILAGTHLLHFARLEIGFTGRTRPNP